MSSPTPLTRFGQAERAAAGEAGPPRAATRDPSSRSRSLGPSRPREMSRFRSEAESGKIATTQVRDDFDRVVRVAEDDEISSEISPGRAEARRRAMRASEKNEEQRV